MGACAQTDFNLEAGNTVVQCNICEDKYPENEIESHLVGVHGVDGPKEMYTNIKLPIDQISLVGPDTGTHNSKSVPQLLGIPPQPKIICGLRNADSGLVSSLKDYSMEKLLSKNKETWKPEVCMNFLNHLLSFTKTSIVEENKVYRFYYNAEEPRKICVDDSHSKDINFVVPDWYLNCFKANSDAGQMAAM